MNFRLFYHSLVSDWNHGNAHFLRGVVAELMARGHDVRVFEPRNGWSLANLVQEQGDSAVGDFRRAFPHLTSHFYDPAQADIAKLLDAADVVIVHEWTEPRVLEAIAEHRTGGGKYCLLFHDTHHRAVSDPDALTAMRLERFDGILAFGASLAEQYRRVGWGRRVWVWHEAADTRVFHPRPALDDTPPDGDVVWIGNWGDNERAAELTMYFVEPVQQLRLHARVHGVRYPADALERLQRAGVEAAGWVPNYRVPDVFARFRVTLHIPRGPYVAMLPGIPTIRPFEALACGIPLISAPWIDCEGLFRPEDFLMVDSGEQMAASLRLVLKDADLASDLRANGLETIKTRHTCAHRVEELLGIVGAIVRGCEGAGASVLGASVLGASVPGATPLPEAPTHEAPKHRAPSHSRTVARTAKPRVAWFGSSILSAYWNGAATYYRGIVRELHRHGVDVTFYEPDAYERQQHRDLEPPAWVTSVVYSATDEGVTRALAMARGADFVVKTSGVGVFDELLEHAVLDIAPGRAIFWDVDAPATLARVQSNPDDPFRRAIPQYALIFTYGGGPPVVDAYKALGARDCVPIYNAVDLDTHHPDEPDTRFAGDMNLLVNRLPDREARIDEFFFRPAASLQNRRFTLGGNGWAGKNAPANVRMVGHVYTADHNRFNCSSMAVLSVNREDMARTGYSPATRVFEAAGAGACLISDAWVGLEEFLEPGREVLAATNGDDVIEHVASLTAPRAQQIGAAAYRRVLAEHTYAHRVDKVLETLEVVPGTRAGVGA
jgi:spore maturation protein CgeB